MQYCIAKADTTLEEFFPFWNKDSENCLFCLLNQVWKGIIVPCLGVAGSGPLLPLIRLSCSDSLAVRGVSLV